MKKKISIGAAVLVMVLAITFLSRLWRDQDDEKDVFLKIYGVVKMGDGIGRQSVELMQLLKDEFSIAFVPTRPMDLTDVPEDIVPMLVPEQKRCKSKVALIEDVVRMPGHSPWKKLVKRTSPDQIRIAYTMQESTRIPPDWVYILNGHFDAVAVPDAFLIDVFKNSGVEIPVFEVPLGLYLGPFYKEPLRKKARRPMVFGNLSSCIERKNQLTLIKGFKKAFGNRDDVSLRINYRYGDDHVILPIREELLKSGVQNVHFTKLPLDSAAYLNFFKSLDCYVSLSRAEGFSIQPREAMALGIPAIVTDNTAQSTICKSGFVCSVASNILEPAVYTGWGTFGKRFDCTIDDVASAFLDMFENYETYLAKTAEAREWVQKYEFKNLKKIYLNLIKPKNVILGDENKITEEYLMTTSQSLYDKYKKL